MRRGMTGCLAAAVLLSTSAVAAADDVHRPIRVSPDGRYLSHPDGQPFFFLAENAEFLLWSLNREDTDLYLKDRAAKGFTVIMAHVVPREDIEQPNAYGAPTFLGGDVSRPNPQYFEHVDWVVDRAAQYGLRLALQPIEGIGYVTEGKFTAQNVGPYATWLARRYHRKGVIWVLGHDSTPIWTTGSLKPEEVVLRDDRAVYDRFAAAIIEGSDDDPFITYHPPCCAFTGVGEPRTSVFWGARKWLDMNMLQSSHFREPTQFTEKFGFSVGWSAVKGYEPIRKEFASHPVRPVVDAEPHWEGMFRDYPWPNEAGGRWDDADIRNAGYQSIFSGAAGHSYGHVSVWAYANPGPTERTYGFIKYAQLPWKEALQAPGAGQLRHLKALMLSRPYYTRIPDQSVVVGETGEGSAHIAATRDRSGAYMMVYSPEGEALKVDLLKLSGEAARAWWYDPRTGASQRVQGEFRTNRSHVFTPPTRGRGADWVLVLDDARKNFSAPGTPYAQSP